MPFSSLISTDVLASHLADSNWIIIDCRFDLSKPQWGFEDYQRAHIPGAVYAHLDNDLSGPKTPLTGRHPLPEQQVFIEKLSRWGIEKGKQVVVYDTTSGSFAVRLWWLLRLYGFADAAVLDGGFAKWMAEDQPTSNGIEVHRPAHFTGQFHPEMIADEEEVERIRQDPHWKLIDARAAERYRGEVEPLDPVAGHIPGAVNRFHGLNLDTSGTLKSSGQLRQDFSDLLDGVPPENVVVYCGSGVTSIHHLLAMEQAGMKGARIYPGSWSQWIRDPKRARTTG